MPAVHRYLEVKLCVLDIENVEAAAALTRYNGGVQ